MTLAAVPPVLAAAPPAQFQLVLAAVLGALGFYYLLPRPGGRSVLWGTGLCAGGLVAFLAFLFAAFGNPTTDTVGNVMFWVFSAVAVGFGAVLVTNANPARGAIAFAFVVLSTCGLFLLLAAPFLMAATVIIYAGAIIVTFLFVLMLSHANGPSAENDRTRDPLLGSLAGFGFAGLVLFTLYSTATNPAVAGPLPVQPLTAAERAALADVNTQLKQAETADSPAALAAATKGTRERLAEVVGGKDAEPEAARPTLQDRLRPAAADPRTELTLRRADDLRAAKGFDEIDNKLLGAAPDLAGAKAEAAKLRDGVAVLAGGGHLPARNVGTIGFLLYSEHLIAVELAGTLLLVATIGAVAIAHGQRKGATP